APRDAALGVALLAAPGPPRRLAGHLRRARLRPPLPPRGRPGRAPAAVHRPLRVEGHPGPHRTRQGRGRGLMGTKAAYDLWWKNAVIYCVDVGLFADRRYDRATTRGPVGAGRV